MPLGKIIVLSLFRRVIEFVFFFVKVKIARYILAGTILYYFGKFMVKCRYKNSDEDFIEAVKTSQSIAEVLDKLGLYSRGENYDNLIKRCEKLGIQAPSKKIKNNTGDFTIRPTLTDSDIINSFKANYSNTSVLKSFGLNPETGANINWLKKKIKSLNIDVSHFTGQLWSKGKELPSKHPLEDYFSGKRKITSHKLRLRLIKDGIFNHECSCCHLSEWLSEPIPLELDHINGNHEDNSFQNLRLLCPNCHAKTPTYKSKNRSKKL